MVLPTHLDFTESEDLYCKFSIDFYFRLMNIFAARLSYHQGRAGVLASSLRS
jgi:hypothetical protein